MSIRLPESADKIVQPIQEVEISKPMRNKDFKIISNSRKSVKPEPKELNLKPL